MRMRAQATIVILLAIPLAASAIGAEGDGIHKSSENYKKLHLEMDYDQVIQLLGKPNAPKGVLNKEDEKHAWIAENWKLSAEGTTLVLVVIKFSDKRVKELRLEYFIMGAGQSPPPE